MSAPVVGLSIVVKDSNGVAVAGSPFTTNASGVISVALLPGKYRVEISALAGYTYAGGTLTEPGQSPVSAPSLTVLDVDVASDSTTTIVGSFNQN
jgi:hypothetical protein